MFNLFWRSFTYVPVVFQSRLFGTKTVLTGLQPTGVPHLGNYLGVIRPLQRLKTSSDLSSLLVTIADLHALTSTGGTNLSTGILELSAALMACLQPSSSNLAPKSQPIVFLQSSVLGHTELAWILASCCTLPRLAHLPQWRDKSCSTSLNDFLELDSSDPVNSTPLERASVGLFTYPVLQAADILLYDAHLVPVGADQTSHIELARDLARVAVHRWPSLKPLLHIPASLVLGVPKIHSLRDPTKKMSKSDSSPTSCIFLTDSPDTIRMKIRRAQTDSVHGVSYDPEKRPGVSNLLRILAAIKDRELNELVQEASGWTKETLKSHVTDALIEELGPISARIAELKDTVSGRSEIESCLTHGSTVARRIATERMDAIYSAVGCCLPGSRLPLSSSRTATVL